MIKKISKLKNCGIFRDFRWVNTLNEFGKDNLIYGLNGSGKSTLSQALSYFNDPAVDTELGNYEIEVVENNNISVKNANNSKLTNPLYVFNKEFINKNIATFDKLDQIIYLSQENIVAKDNIEKLKTELEKQKVKKIETEKNYTELKTAFDKILPDVAKDLKIIFQTVGGYCQKYGNYNKTNIEKFLSQNKNFFTEDFTTFEKQEESLKQSLKEAVLPIILIDLQQIELTQYLSITEKCLKILQRDIKALTVSIYSAEILKWIEIGLSLHNDSTCLYCGENVSQHRKDYLSRLFNDEYKKFKIEVENTIQEIENKKLKPVESNNLKTYIEFKDNILSSILAVNSGISTYNNYITELQKLLQSKLDKIEATEFQIPVNSIDLLNSEIEALLSHIDSNNEKTRQFEVKQEENLLLLEKLLLSKKLKERNYNSTLDNLKIKTTEDKDLEVLMNQQKQEIDLLENNIRDVLIATVNFNSLLHQFLGRAEIELRFDEVAKGYQLIRKENQNKAERLSDGEKSAIALIYFLTKIQENGNKIEDTIIILDDPISSLDSNNLFNAYSFIVSIFENAHQFFILTHNFLFFSLLRRKYGKELRNDKNMYIIENTQEIVNGITQRKAFINALPPILKQLDSEYAYCFKQIRDFSNSANSLVDINEFFVISNSCRKLLETFCSFKFLGKKFDITLIKKLYKIHKEDNYTLSLEEKTKAEKVFKFINYYSHGNNFALSNEIDVVIGETKNITIDVLDLMKYVDELHFNELIEQANR